MVLEGLDMTKVQRDGTVEIIKTTKDQKRQEKVRNILNRYTIVWGTYRCIGIQRTSMRTSGIIGMDQDVYKWMVTCLG
jgi:hypothetical protein